MAKESDTDLLMRFILEGDETVWAECSMRIDPDDTLIDGDFEASDDLHEYTNYFQIDNFSFDISLNEQNVPGKGGGGAGGGGGRAGGGGAGGGNGAGSGILLSDGFLQGTRHAQQQGSARNQQGGGGGSGVSGAAAAGIKKAAGDFASWRSAKDDEIKSLAEKFTPEFKTVKFSKVIDAASPVLFEACVNSRKFDKAIIIKRLSQGSSGADSAVLPLVGYLRLDFKTVQITSVNWSDGDLVTESIVFEAKSIEMRYRSQGYDGRIRSAGEKNVSYDASQTIV